MIKAAPPNDPATIGMLLVDSPPESPEFPAFKSIAYQCSQYIYG